MKKKALQKQYNAHKKRFKNHEFLTDCYEDALDALADYKEYVDLVGHNKSSEERASQLCNHLISQYTHTSNLLPTFKKSARERKQGLEIKKKEIERSLIGWQESRKKALLAQQGPLLKNEYTLILATLEGLSLHIPYAEAYLFAQEHRDLLKEERDLEPFLDDAAHVKRCFDSIIRSKTRVGERYPYRSYTQWLDRYHERVRLLKKELGQHTYFEFQQPVIDYIASTYVVLDALRKNIKSSKAFEDECIQYDAELRAHETDHLKKQLAQLS